ncbi:hypothetical protein HYFRA_00013071 [Hymenoscyphus fraxineus]|uniref:Non-homologous end-joining factor 1 n=1 Tax=Hymenoscyphus fraxineus TaxID=746836 RepID=A0A9N9PTM5_9HELO|nr:hypothetical protein HYFRA_00013071 [Hymenoscyphus fraxineus]
MAWQPLRALPPANSQLPPLLISFAFPSNDSYVVLLTDLTNLWSESLSKREIIRRSQEEGTSIDPSSVGQLGILLEKIKLGLEGAHGTTAALTINTDDERPSMTLDLKVPLPGGLLPLEWPIRLSAASQTQLAARFVIPLIGAQQARMQDVKSLAEALRDKDHVIQKLLDKLEYQGTSLGEVFPQAAGKSGRKIDRKTAEERVKGLGQFNLASWNSNSKREVSHDTVSLLSEVFRRHGSDEEFIIEAGSENEGVEEEEAWWEDIRGATVNLENGKISTNRGRSKVKSKSPFKTSPKPPKRELSPNMNDASDGNNDFQTQELPNHLKTNGAQRAATEKAAAEPSADSDDDDLDAPSQLSKIPDSFPISQPRISPPLSRRSQEAQETSGKDNLRDQNTDDDEPVKPMKKTLEGVGRKKALVPKANTGDSSTDDDEPVTKPNKRLRRFGSKETQSESRNEQEDLPPTSPPEPASETATEDEGPTSPKELQKKAPDVNDDSETASSAPSSPAAPKRKGGLGRVGGNKKGKVGQIGGSKAPAKDSTSDSEDGDESGPKTTTPAKKKLGQVGGHKKEASSPASAASQKTGTPDRGRPVAGVKREATPEVRETSEERADKKRLEIKRQLEAKAKAPPAKKKRKF